MRRNWLITGLMMVLGVTLVTRLALQFGLPAFLRAQTTPPATANTIGPHVAFFDVGNNIKIQQMIKSKSPGNIPVTVMVDINASEGEINTILAESVGLSPMVRIVGVNSGTMADTSKASAIATNLNNSNIPAGTLVILGNELNNLAKEWGNPGDTLSNAGSTYGNAFLTFQAVANSGGKFTAVPAPPDMYNGDYDWHGFVQGAQSVGGVYSGTLVANVYDIPGTPGLEMYTQLEQFGGHVAQFTEYGPHPDKSLQEHLDFYKTHTPPRPATTLVPDKCSTKPDTWLYYIDGKIYDADGNLIDPATCSNNSNRGEPPAGDYYKRFVYPFYSQKSTVDDIVQKLSNAYTVTCANPANYNADLAGDIRELIEAQGCGAGATACLFSPDAIFSLDASGKNRLFGVLRNETEVKWRAYDAQQEGNALKRSFTNRWESVEQWLGANNPPQSNETAYLNKAPAKMSTLHQGPFYKLSTLEAQCVAAGEVMKQRVSLCDEWSALPENAGKTCSLANDYVPGTGKPYRTVNSEYINAGGPAFCERYYSDPKYTSVYADQIIADDVSKVDLYMEKAYRPAFLVLVTMVDEDNGQVPPQKLISKDRGGSTGKQVVDYLVYHVPDTITDVDSQDPQIYPDIATRTVNTFITDESRIKYFEDWKAGRAELATQIDSAKASPLPTVDCHGGVCEETLRKALIQFINGYAQFDPNLQCGNVPKGLTESGVKIGSQLAPIDSPEGLTKSSAKADIGVRELRDVNGVVQPRGDALQTRIYNISPFGGRSQYVAEAFDALFSTKLQRSQFSEEKKYYSTFEAIFGETLETKPDFKFYGKTVVDENGNTVTETKSVTDTISVPSANFGARFPYLAKIFNLSTRAAVQQVANSGQALLECAKKISDPKRNTEDFLLNCQTRGGVVGSGSSTSPNQYSDYATEDFDPFEIQYWNASYITFGAPPSIVWEAAKEAADRHGGDALCDPFLLIALAHSESPNFTNVDIENGAEAMGVWQITNGNWGDMWKPLDWFNKGNFSKIGKSTDGSITRFDCTIPSRLGTSPDPTACIRTNIYAAADAACRFSNALGMMNPELYADQGKFLATFSSPPVNPYDGLPGYERVWNICPIQGEYVWRLWHSIKEPASRAAYKDKLVQLPKCW